MSDYTCCDHKQDTPYCGYCGEKKEFVSFSFGYLSSHVSDWNDFCDFCDDVGLDPYCMNCGRTDSDATLAVEVGVLKKYGILPGGE